MSHCLKFLHLVRRTLLLGIVGAATVIAFVQAAQAKDLSNRLGIGFRNAFPFSLPAIAVHYHPSTDLGLLAAIGVDTQDLNSKLGLQLGVRKVIFKEDHMNFFMGGTFSMLTQETPTGASSSNKNSGYEIAAVVGSEFFFSGLDNLAFNIETGVAVTSLDKVRFRTLGDDMLRAGVAFYF